MSQNIPLKYIPFLKLYGMNLMCAFLYGEECKLHVPMGESLWRISWPWPWLPYVVYVSDSICYSLIPVLCFILGGGGVYGV